MGRKIKNYLRKEVRKYEGRKFISYLNQNLFQKIKRRVYGKV